MAGLWTTGQCLPPSISTGQARSRHSGGGFSLTFDHRVVTGGEAARFPVALKADLELRV
jgi:hypothetical protein